jgi:hypothetical protein
VIALMTPLRDEPSLRARDLRSKRQSQTFVDDVDVVRV